MNRKPCKECGNYRVVDWNQRCLSCAGAVLLAEMKAAPPTMAAMGKQDGDFVRLSNTWAEVVISREKRVIEVEPKIGRVPAMSAERFVYVVTGDTWDGDPTSYKQNGPTKREYVFNTGPAALRFAFQSLAAYEHGSIRNSG